MNAIDRTTEVTAVINETIAAVTDEEARSLAFALFDAGLIVPDKGPCLSCDRPRTNGLFCLPCAADEELRVTEEERIRCRDLMAEMVKDEDGLPGYDFADAVWLTLYKAGFDIMRRPVAGSMGPPG